MPDLQRKNPPRMVNYQMPLTGKGHKGDKHTFTIEPSKVYFRADRLLATEDIAKTLFVRGRDSHGKVFWERRVDGVEGYCSLKPGSTIEVDVRFVKDGQWTGTFFGVATKEG